MNVSARFASDAYTAAQNEGIKACIRGVEDRFDLSLDEIRTGYSEKVIAARRALICTLANLGLPLKKIREITHTSIAETTEILNARRDYGVPVRTMNWGAFV